MLNNLNFANCFQAELRLNSPPRTHLEFLRNIWDILTLVMTYARVSKQITKRKIRNSFAQKLSIWNEEMQKSPKDAKPHC